MNNITKIIIAGSVWLIWTLIAESLTYQVGSTGRFSIASLATIALFNS